mmetsp:Transcript_47917/g.91605  ORF Transcript_47917/g.91605 Transcript_47917/m.91605 type:complete len:294 (-) Transcript_47917:236-1117(-)
MAPVLDLADDPSGLDSADDLSTSTVIILWICFGAICLTYFVYRSMMPCASQNRGAAYTLQSRSGGSNTTNTVAPGTGSSVLRSRPSSKAREEVDRANRLKAVDRLQQQHNEAVAAAKTSAEEKLEADRQAALKLMEEKAQAQREAAAAEEQRVKKEAEKNRVLMDEMRARKEAQQKQYQEELEDREARRREAVEAANREKVTSFQKVSGHITVYAKKAEGEDQRVLLEGIHAGTKVVELRGAVEMALTIPIDQQTLVINGVVLGHQKDETCLVEFLRPKMTELCVVVLRKRAA